MDITERLVLFLQHEGLTPFQMNKAAGLSRTLLAKAIDKHQGLSSGTLEKISNTYPNLNIDWLVTGRGEMLIAAEPPKIINKKILALPKDLESSIYRQIVWHLLLQDTYSATHDRLVEIIDMLNNSVEKNKTLSEQLSRIRQLIESQYTLQAQDHGLYEMTLKIAAGEDGKYIPEQLKEEAEITNRLINYLLKK